MWRQSWWVIILLFLKTAMGLLPVSYWMLQNISMCQMNVMFGACFWPRLKHLQEPSSLDTWRLKLWAFILFSKLNNHFDISNTEPKKTVSHLQTRRWQFKMQIRIIMFNPSLTSLDKRWAQRSRYIISLAHWRLLDYIFFICEFCRIVLLFYGIRSVWSYPPFWR